MIHYALRCGAEHGFDGWFADSGAFDRQAAAGLIACPGCGRADVTRALMAPSVARGKRGDAAGRAAPPATGGPPAEQPAGLPAATRAALQKLRAQVERECEHVGDAFADLALQMHRGEIDHRHIYGDATPEDAGRLRDEGVPLALIPWVPRAEG